MSGEDFEKNLKHIVNRTFNVLSNKAKEYASEIDRMHNFNIGASITNTSRERVLDGFLLKHYISYRDMLNDIDSGNLPTIEYLDEKMGDILNYFILFECSVKDKIRKNEFNKQNN